MIYSDPKVSPIFVEGDRSMPASLTEKEFSQLVGTKFHVNVDQREIELELTEVKGYTSPAIEQGGMERFSIFFAGAGDPFLPQKVYRLKHQHMGEFELLLVPIAGDEKGYRYEAVFNYFKT
ncbi:MAG TPA: hypothetical protein VN966_02565 [Candidatus Bathyarchaeia archaeon]|nr:hypothetical protein [Candidatus Bathyarchaeia archaeon]